MINCIVHKFRLSDVDDVEIYAAEPIYKFQQTEKGKWVMENSVDTYWCKHFEPHTYGYVFAIHAKMTETDYTYFKLKYE